MSAYYFRRYQKREDTLSLDDFLRQQRPYVLSNFEIYSIGSKVVADFVGRYEHLLADFEKVLRHVGIAEPVELPRLKAGARTDKRPYREVINPEQRALIAQRCQTEIQLLGYRFDEEGMGIVS